MPVNSRWNEGLLKGLGEVKLKLCTLPGNSVTFDSHYTPKLAAQGTAHTQHSTFDCSVSVDRTGQDMACIYSIHSCIACSTTGGRGFTPSPPPHCQDCQGHVLPPHLIGSWSPLVIMHVTPH